MEEDGDGHKRRRLQAPEKRVDGNEAEELEEGEEVEEGDPAVWGELDRNLRQVQAVLDRNRVLIQQVNENHLSKISENLVKNVALIREINDNVSKVVGMYSDLATHFSRAALHHRAKADHASAPPHPPARNSDK